MQANKISTVGPLGPEVNSTELIYNWKYSNFPQYRQFILESHPMAVFTMGDFVIVEKNSRPKFSKLTGRRHKIAKLRCVFYKSDSSALHAEVNWFLKVGLDCPLKTPPGIPPLHDREIIWDSSVPSEVIPLSAILDYTTACFAPCHVSPEEFLATQDEVYIVRFAARQNGGQGKLVPYPRQPEFAFPETSPPLREIQNRQKRVGELQEFEGTSSSSMGSASSGKKTRKERERGSLKSGKESSEERERGSLRSGKESSEEGERGSLRSGKESSEEGERGSLRSGKDSSEEGERGSLRSGKKSGGKESSEEEERGTRGEGERKKNYFGFDIDDEVDEELQKVIEASKKRKAVSGTSEEEVVETETPSEKEKRLLGEIVALYEVINPELKNRPGRPDTGDAGQEADSVDRDAVLEQISAKMSEYFRVQQPSKGPVESLSVDRDPLFRVYVRHKFGLNSQVPDREPEIYILRQKLQVAMGGDGQRFIHVHGPTSSQLPQVIEEALKQVRSDSLFCQYYRFQVVKLDVRRLSTAFKKHDIEKIVTKNFINQFILVIVNLDRLNERNVANVCTLTHLVWLTLDRPANLVLLTWGQKEVLPEAITDRIMPSTPMVKLAVRPL